MRETSKTTKDTTPPPETHPGVRCEKCGGIGKVEPEYRFPDGTALVQPGFIKTCPACHGTGKQRG